MFGSEDFINDNLLMAVDVSSTRLISATLQICIKLYGKEAKIHWLPFLMVWKKSSALVEFLRRVLVWRWNVDPQFTYSITLLYLK